MRIALLGALVALSCAERRPPRVDPVAAAARQVTRAQERAALRVREPAARWPDAALLDQLAHPPTPAERDGLGTVTDRALAELPVGCAPDRPRLAQLRAALHRDPGEAMRIARQFVDGDVLLACRVPAVVSELVRDGEPDRALAFAEQLIDDEPDDAAAALLAADVAALDLDPPRAMIFVQQAESLAPADQRGAASLQLSRRFRSLDLPIVAIGFARQGVTLAATDGERTAAYAEVLAAQLESGREADARLTWNAIDTHEETAHALALATRMWPAWINPPAAHEPRDFVPALIRGTPAALDAALAFNPGSVVLREARGRAATPGSPERAVQERALLLIGRNDDGVRGGEALRALARLADSDGDEALAAAARAEARLLPL